MNYNSVCQVGRLTKEPILRHTQQGTAVSSFTIAVNRDYTNEGGERNADFLPVVVWKRTAENCCKYLKKGSLVLVAGKLQSRSYQDSNGKNVNVIEIVADIVKFLDTPPSNQHNTNHNNNNNGTDRNQNYTNHNQNGNDYEGPNNDFPSYDNDPFANSGSLSNDDWPF